MAYLRSLLNEREIPANNGNEPEERRRLALAKLDAGEFTKRQASATIEWLKGQPRRTDRPAQTSFGEVTIEWQEIETDDGVKRVGRIHLASVERPILSGSYGVDTGDDDRFTNDTTFFKVWINEEYGRGWGVKMYVSDDTSKVKLAFPTQVAALKKIAVDPVAASALFGHEFKRCGVCGRGLTNDESRTLGIGPVCRRRLG